MKLCDFCITNVLESKESWDYHHKSYESLQKSSGWVAEHDDPGAAKERKIARCLICWRLDRDIEKLAPKLKNAKYAAAWPVCRWNIRTLAHIRESLEAVVITFRYVPPISELADYQEVELPPTTFLLFPEDHVQPLPTLEQLGPSTNPVHDGGRQIRKWLETCDLKHPDCMKRRKTTPKNQRFVPTRLLDISGKPGKPIRVIETATTSVQGPYCSLSHCWGRDPTFYTLREENKDKCIKDGVPWHLFTKNFQDAIEIARALEVGYIWIDSLCIVQGSAKDWEHEANKMHLVYRNSYCNIALAAAKDSTGGAFRDRDPQDVSPVRYTSAAKSPYFGSKDWVVVSENLWDHELIQESLYGRGWVFQERMLAPRILHFAQRQIFWDCPSLSACETLPMGLPQPMDGVAGPDRHWRARLQEPENSQDLAGGVDQPMGVFWKTAVKEYTSCDLTNGADKLIAMWGIAKLIRDAINVEYGDGLWEDNLEDQLAWRMDECREVSARNMVAKIPSWSWASMNGTIIVPDRMSDQPHYKVTDHDGRALSFDLKGARGTVDTTPKKPVVRPPLMPIRGISDSGPELERRSNQLEKEQPGVVVRRMFPRSSSPDIVNRDDQPEFHSKSIRIQGHIGQGQLWSDDTDGTWTLRVKGITEIELEAFPDTFPRPEERWGSHRYFVVLAAKQMFKGDAATGRINGKSGLAKISEDEEHEPQEDFDYTGHGIMIRPVGDHHFRRTGSFRFRNASSRVFKKLLQTEDWEKVPPEMYHMERGRKFWLD